MTTDPRRQLSSEGSSSQRLYASNRNKRHRVRVIPEWLEKNALPVGADQRPPHSVNDQEALSEVINCSLDGNVIGVKLLAEAGVNLNMQDSNGWTPLHHAMANGKDDVVDMLIQKGANGDIQNKDGLSPLEMMRLNKDNSHSLSTSRDTSERLI